VLNVGDMIVLGVTDYCYGVGPLRMRVTHVPEEINHPGLEWVRIMGVEVTRHDVDGRHRIVTVRVAALRGLTTSHRRKTGQAAA
jgi:hypothetical protein